MLAVKSKFRLVIPNKTYDLCATIVFMCLGAYVFYGVYLNTRTHEYITT